jgi:sulfatase maturation enzyme AslB (radical SAM superfamily)
MGFRTNIATNAFLIDEDMAKSIADSGLSSINLSLDSMCETTHDYLRGKEGVYRNVMQAIECMDKYCSEKFEIIICSAIYDINMEDAIGIAEWVNQHPRVKWAYFMAAMQPNNTKPDPGWYKGGYSCLWPQDTSRVVSVIDVLIGMKNSGYKINNQVCQLEAFKKYFSCPDRFVKNAACNLYRAVHVSSIGDIFICYDWERIGNIREDDLAEAWYSAKADSARRSIKNCKKNCHHLINCFFEGDYPFGIV